MNSINRIGNNFKNLKDTSYLDQFLASSPLPLIVINDNKKKLKID